MTSLFDINIGKPQHGWLPVDFHYHGFQIDFMASDAINNPIDELYQVIVNLQSNQTTGQVTWWLEPAAYLFEFEKVENNIVLTLSEIDDLQAEYSEKRILQIIRADHKELLLPFIQALERFYSQSYDKDHWTSGLDTDEFHKLINKG